MRSRDLRRPVWRVVQFCSALFLASSVMFACGGIEGPTDTVGSNEYQLVEKIIKLPGPSHVGWGFDADWDCQPGYEDPGCPAPGFPGCTIGDVDSGNCVCIWPDYCEPFFD